MREKLNLKEEYSLDSKLDNDLEGNQNNYPTETKTQVKEDISLQSFADNLRCHFAWRWQLRALIMLL